MGSRVQTEKQAPQEQEKPADVKPADLSEKGGELKDKADEIIDMIDDVLEKNAEQFVQNYIQRGGQ